MARIRHGLELTGSYLRGAADEVTSLRESDGDMEAPRVQVHLNTLKVMAAELTFDAADRCVQLAGLGQGYLRNSNTSLERTLRDLGSASLNYSNDRLLKANGLLSLADPSVTLL
ncbi:hypothetical protein ACIGJO_21205 [Streptomyces sp. NPDC079020]|uniref:hypothetical protein n=1 Tax=Streptomyces sp. NPDC079020 TaxID=3365722 RepID=UPI0037CDD67F